MMTAPLRLSRSPDTRTARGQYRGEVVENSFKFDTRDAVKRRKWFASLLWRAFPASSEHELAIRAAPVLDVTPRQVQNWLRGDHDAKLGTILAVLTIAGAENIFDIIARR